MKKEHPSSAITAVMLTLASLTLPLVEELSAAEIFTRITDGPGGDIANSAGAAWGDFDNDGFIDLFVAQRGPGGTGPASQFLYHNNTDGTFTRVTNGPVAALLKRGAGTAWGDYDNDGYLDLVLTIHDQANYLFHNNGEGSFTETPATALVSDVDFSRGVTWVDYDNDGYLDLFRTVGVAGNLDLPRRLYHNNGDGTFTRMMQGDFLTTRGGYYAPFTEMMAAACSHMWVPGQVWMVPSMPMPRRGGTTITTATLIYLYPAPGRLGPPRAGPTFSIAMMAMEPSRVLPHCLPTIRRIKAAPRRVANGEIMTTTAG
jgi:hypothetical protein